MRCGVVFAKLAARQAAEDRQQRDAADEERLARHRKPAPPKPVEGRKWKTPSHGTLRDVCDSLARLLAAGISVFDALHNLAGTAGPKLAPALKDIGERIKSGRTLGDALSAHPQLFHRADIHAIHAAEQTGRVPDALRAIAQRHERALMIRRRLAKSAAYPLIVLILSVFLNPIPKLIFGGSGAYWGSVATNLGIIASLAAFLIFGIPWIWGKTKLGRSLRRAFWRLPWPASLWVAHVRAAFAAGLGNNLSAGLPLYESLRSAAAIPDDPTTDDAIEDVCARIDAGEGIAAPLAGSGLVAPNDQMIVLAGERSGTLEDALKTIAATQSDRFLRGLGRLLTVLGALLMIGVGLWVAMGILDSHETIRDGVGDVMKLLENEMPYYDLKDLQNLK